VNKTTKKKSTLSELKSKERQDRKDLIIDAAERVFATRPFNRVSMREIADEAGIAASSIYTYFPNQEALFVEATVRDSTTFLDELGKITAGGPVTADSFDRLIDTFFDFISTHDSYFRMMVVFMTHGQLNPDSLLRVNALVGRGLDIFEQVISDLGYRGDTRLLAHYFFAMMNGILVNYRKYEGRREEEVTAFMKKVAKVFKDLLLKSI